MNRLIEKIVFCGFVTCWRRAGAPTRRWPSLVNATTDGVVRPPSAFGITGGSPPSSTAMQLLVVPRSIPMVFAMCLLLLLVVLRKSECLYSRSWLGASAEGADQGRSGHGQGGARERAAAGHLAAA